MDVDFDFFDDVPKSQNASFKSSPKTRSERSHLSDSDGDVDEESRAVESGRGRKAIKAHIPRALESDDSDSDSGRRAPTPDRKERARSADSADYSTDDSEDRGKAMKASNRPKSGRRKQERPRKDSDNVYSDESYATLSNSDRDSDTDSEVTDVSPLNSPRAARYSKSRNTEDTLSDRARQSKPPVSPMHTKSSRSRPTSAHTGNKDQVSSRVENLLQANHDSVDMKLLLEAVLEMERERKHTYDRSSRASSAGRSQKFKPAGPAPQPKKNYSFRNDQVRKIDLENQRMMKSIMHCAKQAKQTKKRVKAKPVVQQIPSKAPTAAINRSKEQQRIERENQALLQRLQQTKATRPVQRERLMHDYNSAMIYGYSVAAAHDQIIKSPPRQSPYGSSSALSGPHTSSQSSLPPSERAKSSVGASPGKRSRPVSATSTKSTPPSFKPVAAPKNAWESSW